MSKAVMISIKPQWCELIAKKGKDHCGCENFKRKEE